MVAIDGIGEEGPDLLRPGIEEKPFWQIGCDTQECSQLDCDFRWIWTRECRCKAPECLHNKTTIPWRCTGDGEVSSGFSPQPGTARLHDAAEAQAGYASDDKLPDTDGDS